MKKATALAAILLITGLMIAPQAGFAQDFVYEPINPAFGGSPLNYSWLLSSAGAQNQYQGSSGFGFNRDPLANFEERLQRQILFNLTREIIGERLDNINLNEQGTFQLGNFSIEFFPGPDGLNIIILNVTTGERTTVTIPNF